MGVSWLLTTFYWSRIEEAEGQWNFDDYDKYVDTAKTAGKKIIGVLAYDVPWIHKDGKTRKYIPPDKIHLYLNYIRQTAAHFKSRVDAWCIWNEPNFIFWKGSRNEYLSLARQAADALRETDTKVILLSGAFNRGVFGLPTAYINGLFESGAMDKADAVAFHPYELNPGRTARLFLDFRAQVAKYGFEDRIWITEAGYPTGGLYPTAVSEKKFPAYIVKTFVNLSVCGAKRILWYQLFDPQNRSGTDSEDFFGLVRSRDDYTSKGAEAFRLCAVYLSGAAYHPELPLRENLPGNLHAFYFEQPSGGRALVLWKEGKAINLDLLVSGSDCTRHDIVTGNAEAIPAQMSIAVGSTPVFITWQGGGVPSLQVSGKR
ncbi:MAG: hypothetical protein LBU85_03890 [Treponema sp.]|jgi:hypothetical protein|nr:hypothetical protein [Treponema sp.]